MDQFVTYTVFGVVLAAIYAIAASGLVVTYTTSGIFNFAHGAVGMLGAFAYWQFHVKWGWPTLLSIAVVLLVIAPLIGVFVERVVMRGLQGVSEVTKVVVTIALLFTLIQVAPVIWSPKGSYSVQPFFGAAKIDLAGAGVTYHQLIVIGVAIVVAAGLRALLYGTRLGIGMRAVVDNRMLAELNGARPDRMSAFSWILGSALAALAGILIAERIGLETVALTFLVVNAYAAAVVGRLTSLTRTYVGALLLGLGQAYAQGYLPDNPTWFAERNLDIRSLSLAIPVIMLFVVLLLIPHARLRAHGIVRSRELIPRPTYRWSLVGFGVLIGVVSLLSGALSGEDTLIWSQGLCFGIIMLSLVPLTGYGGQISLAQMSFAGLGAYAIATWGGGGNPLGVVLAVLLAAAAGILVALPALRLRGIYLALATLAFAYVMEKVVFNQRALFPTTSKPVDRLWGLESNRAYLIFLAVVFSLVGFGIVWLRRSKFGRRLQAMKDSPAACATLGLNLTVTKLQVFILSAGIAGLGGALFAGANRAAATDSFSAVQNLPVLLMAVAGGIAMVSGALTGGLLLASFSLATRSIPTLELFGVDAKSFFENLFRLAPGLIGITLGRDPNGLVAMVSDKVKRLWERRLQHRGTRDLPVPATRWQQLVEPVWAVESMGVDTPFVPEEIARIDERLALDEEEVRAGVFA
ncbi:MAG: ABC transporter permease [Acidimicrobiales bacterium]|nr:ABC transporter permease [Acidimicrobiales bacterium]